MNTYILVLAIFSSFLFNSHQLVSMHASNPEQLELNEQLLKAAKAGNKDTVISLLEQGADVNHATNDYGHIDIVRLLIEHGAHVNHDFHQTALKIAARKGYIDIVKMLIEHGKDEAKYDAHLNIRNHQALTPRSLAQKYRNRQDIIRILKPMAGQALLALLSTEGQEQRFGVFYTNNDTSGTAQTLGVLPDGILPAEIAANIAHFVVTQRQPEQARSNPNSNS